MDMCKHLPSVSSRCMGHQSAWEVSTSVMSLWEGAGTELLKNKVTTEVSKRCEGAGICSKYSTHKDTQEVFL